MRQHVFAECIACADCERSACFVCEIVDEVLHFCMESDDFFGVVIDDFTSLIESDVFIGTFKKPYSD